MAKVEGLQTHLHFLTPLLPAAFLLAAGAALASQGDIILDVDTEAASLPEENKAAISPTPASQGLVVPIGPLFIQRSDEVSRVILFPLVFHEARRGKEGQTFRGIFPFYTWSSADGSRALVVFPFWWHFSLPGESIFLVPPIYLQHRPGDLFRLVLGPLFLMQRGKNTSFTFIPPLVWHLRRGSSSFFYAVLLYRLKKEDGWAAGLIPLLFWGGSKKRQYRVIFPLFWHFSDEALGTSRTILPPFYYTRKLDEWQAGLIPVFFSSGSADVTNITVLPLLHFRKNKAQGSIMAVTPLGWYTKNESKKARGGGFYSFTSTGAKT